jgi:membrane protease YdiL (CAAX protease family)
MASAIVSPSPRSEAPVAYPTIKNVLVWLPVMFVLPVVAVIVVGIVAGVSGVSGVEPLKHPLVTPLAVLLPTVAIVVWSAWRGRLRPLQILASPGRVTPKAAAFLLGGAFGVHLLISELDNLFRFLGVTVPSTLPQGFFSHGFWAPFTLIVIAPVAEELVFRGIMLRGFLLNYGRTKAIAASTIVFTIYHLNPAQTPAALGLGLLLGTAFVATGSVWFSIVTHGLFNSLNYVAVAIATVVAIPGYNALNPDGSVPTAFQPWWLDAIALGLVVAAFYWFVKQPPFPVPIGHSQPSQQGSSA